MEANEGLSEERVQTYRRFVDWFVGNGGLISPEVAFPAVFQPGSYLGLLASKDIKINKVILAVPQHLIISLTKVKQSELKHLIEKEQILNDEDDSDTEFNVLVLYLIYEHLKGTVLSICRRQILLLSVFPSSRPLRYCAHLVKNGNRSSG